jgi:membrane associated rhomboid family serine protease
MNTLWKDIKFKMLHSASRVTRLIWINIIVYLSINIPGVVETFFFRTGFISFYTDKYLLLPSNPTDLWHRAWTPFTYMFMHAGPFHILFNMLWLYWMGQIFEEYLGNKRTVGVYILGGLTGALFFVLAYNLSPLLSHASVGGASLTGASAAVMAIIVATATLLPDYTIFLMFIGPVKLKWLVLFYVILDFLSIAGSNAGGEISHLGGALFGFIYIRQLQRGNDLVGFFAGLFKKRSNLKVAAKNNLKNAGNKPRQEDVDRILDKISQTGYDSLSKQEKEILFRASKDNEG